MPFGQVQMRGGPELGQVKHFSVEDEPVHRGVHDPEEHPRLDLCL